MIKNRQNACLSCLSLICENLFSFFLILVFSIFANALTTLKIPEVSELGLICKTHVCKQINVLLGPTLFISKSCSKEDIYLDTLKS